MKCGEMNDLWIDQGIHGGMLDDHVGRDFPGQKNDFHVHSLGTEIKANCRNIGSSAREHVISYVIANDLFRASLYLLPRRKMRLQHEHLRSIVRSLGTAIENALRIERLETAAGIDLLTNCCNRRAFTKHLENSIAISQRYDHSLSLMLVGIDDLSGISDTYGHGTGNQVLRSAGALISSSVRKSDFLARYGGEVFALLMPETGLFYATQIAGKLRKRLGELTVDAGGQTIGITASFGVAELRKNMSAAAFLHDADVRLYAARDHGRAFVIPVRADQPSIPQYGSVSSALQCT